MDILLVMVVIVAIINHREVMRLTKARFRLCYKSTQLRVSLQPKLPRISNGKWGGGTHHEGEVAEPRAVRQRHLPSVSHPLSHSVSPRVSHSASQSVSHSVMQ